MNLLQIKYFHAVCTYQTISSAAEYLYITQPALSNAIKELEKEFGVVLFERHHKGMVLTDEGEAFYKMSKDILSHTEQIELSMREMGKGRKALRLGVPPMIGAIFLPQVFRGFNNIYPDIELKITEGGRKELTEKLSQNFLDMVFLPHNKALEHSLEYYTVGQLETVCCVSKKNPLSNLKTVEPKNLKDIPLVLFKDSFFQTELIKKWFSDYDITPDVLLQTGQLSTVESLISDNITVGFLFRQLISHSPDFCAIPINMPMFTDISLVWKKGIYPTQSMDKFLQYVKDKIKI